MLFRSRYSASESFFRTASPVRRRMSSPCNWGKAWAGASDNDLIRDKLTIAYEPVWAIGTGKTASNHDAEEACAFIRAKAAGRFGKAVSESVRILYGGSVKPENSAGILSQPNVDGLLIGGASLEVDSFSRIIESAIPNN